jgi:hypothetical protein
MQPKAVHVNFSEYLAPIASGFAPGCAQALDNDRSQPSIVFWVLILTFQFRLRQLNG